jgi:hypothetical protein
MGGYLLLPEDELVLVAHFQQTESLELLATDDLSGGPRLLKGLSEPLPLPPPPRPGQETAEPGEFVFWARELGELRALRDAPEPTIAVERIERMLVAEAAENAESILDYARSPIIRWHRASWHSSGALCPGLLQAQARKTSEQPPELLRLHGRLGRWMSRQSERFEAFDHAPADVREQRPRNTRPFVVRAFPRAAAWVKGGGQIWPWNA